MAARTLVRGTLSQLFLGTQSSSHSITLFNTPAFGGFVTPCTTLSLPIDLPSQYLGTISVQMLVPAPLVTDSRVRSRVELDRSLGHSINDIISMTH